MTSQRLQASLNALRTGESFNGKLSLDELMRLVSYVRDEHLDGESRFWLIFLNGEIAYVSTMLHPQFTISVSHPYSKAFVETDLCFIPHERRVLYGSVKPPTPTFRFLVQACGAGHLALALGLVVIATSALVLWNPFAAKEAFGDLITIIAILTGFLIAYASTPSVKTGSKLAKRGHLHNFKRADSTVLMIALSTLVSLIVARQLLEPVIGSDLAFLAKTATVFAIVWIPLSGTALIGLLIARYFAVRHQELIVGGVMEALFEHERRALQQPTSDGD